MSRRLTPEFVSLQLALVDRFFELGLGSYSEGVHRLTNFQRRLGLGTPTDPPSNSAWIDLLLALAMATSHDDRVDIVITSFDSLPAATPEHIVRGWPTVGAFSVERSGNVARTHFFSTDDDGESPLQAGKIGLRRDELLAVLTTVCSEFPEIDQVAGGSWLYKTRSYSSLFPAAHIANAATRRGRNTFRGMSHWGQFIDHRGELRPELGNEFRRRVQAWRGQDPCTLFPIETLDVSSPLSVFDVALRRALD